MSMTRKQRTRRKRRRKGERVVAMGSRKERQRARDQARRQEQEFLRPKRGSRWGGRSNFGAYASRGGI